MVMCDHIGTSLTFFILAEFMLSTASKTCAERAAWEFVEKQKPNFDLVTLCPPLVFGPVIHSLKSLDELNTSNKRIWGLLSGGARNEVSALVSIGPRL